MPGLYPGLLDQQHGYGNGLLDLLGPGMLDQMQASSARFQDVAGTQGLAAAMRDPVHDQMGQNVAGAFDFTGGLGLGGMAGMLLDAKQLAKPRGKIDAAYPPWGSLDFTPGKEPRNVTIYKNPSNSEVEKLTQNGDLRAVWSKDKKELFVWPADAALHPEVADDVFANPRVQSEASGIWTNNYNQGIIPGAKR